MNPPAVRGIETLDSLHETTLVQILLTRHFIAIVGLCRFTEQLHRGLALARLMHQTLALCNVTSRDRLLTIGALTEDWLDVRSLHGCRSHRSSGLLIYDLSHRNHSSLACLNGRVYSVDVLGKSVHSATSQILLLMSLEHVLNIHARHRLLSIASLVGHENVAAPSQSVAADASHFQTGVA